MNNHQNKYLLMLTNNRGNVETYFHNEVCNNFELHPIDHNLWVFSIHDFNRATH